MDDILTEFALEDLDESISFALLLRLHKNGALSDRDLRAALRMVAGDLIALLVALDSIDADRLKEAFHEVVLESLAKKGGKGVPN